MCVCHCKALWSDSFGGISKRVCVKWLVDSLFVTSVSLYCSLSPLFSTRPAVVLLYCHEDIIIAFLLQSKGCSLASSSTTAAAEERQSWTRGLSRRRSEGGGWVGGGWGEGSHSGPDLAVGSQLATLVLWLKETTYNLFISNKGYRYAWRTHI